MKNRIGLIGVGHLGQYLVTGLSRADKDLEFFLADISTQKAKAFSAKYDCFFTTRNQDVIERSEIVILATRPENVAQALADVEFKPEQILVSVAAGVPLKTLEPLVLPAKVVRALPISCVAINKSPVLIFPEDKFVKDLFSLVGQVHLLPDEDKFSPGTAVVGAFYAWLFLLMDEATHWTADKGIDPDTARKLVIETVEGACAMAAEQENISLAAIWKTLATPGGISEHGAGILSKGGGIKIWSEALEAIHRRLKGQLK